MCTSDGGHTSHKTRESAEAFQRSRGPLAITIVMTGIFGDEVGVVSSPNGWQIHWPSVSALLLLGGSFETVRAVVALRGRFYLEATAAHSANARVCPAHLMCCEREPINGICLTRIIDVGLRHEFSR